MNNGEEEEDISAEPIKNSGDLKIKLKFPEDNQDQVLTSTNEKKRICHFCSKGFASGKALGGHMRIHFQVHKQQQQPMINSSSKKKKLKPIKKKLQKRPSSSSGGGENQITLSDFAKKLSEVVDNNPICVICFKTFPSEKSLFGHMRCHPGRDWRGTRPPPPPPPLPEQDQDQLINSTVFRPPVDLMESLRDCNWVVATAKRGSKGINKKPIDDDDDEEFLDAANELIRLAHGSVDEEYEATNSNSLGPTISGSKKRRFEEISNNNNKVVADEETGKEYEEESKNMNNGTSGKSTRNGKVIILKNKKKMRKIKDLESVQDASSTRPVVVHDKAMTATPDKYRCSSCTKSFPTHQALGGHRSTHNKIKLLGWTDDDDDLVLEDEQIMIKGNEMAATNGNFSTPRGRKKWSAEAQSSQVTSVGEVSHTCGGGGGRVLEFDLNEAPPMEDDIGGHASSSFNSVDQFPVFESSSSRLL